MTRAVVAGFGNTLCGDDGFGVEVIRRLAATPLGSGVRLLDIGTGGIRLAQELLTPCDRLIVVDAMRRGGAPGAVYVLEVESVEAIGGVDMHLTVPASALAVAKALGVLPREVYLVGCEPAQVDEPSTELTPPVRRAVDAAVRHVGELLARP